MIGGLVSSRSFLGVILAIWYTRNRPLKVDVCERGSRCRLFLRIASKDADYRPNSRRAFRVPYIPGTSFGFVRWFMWLTLP